jgi:hypothetical protein
MPPPNKAPAEPEPNRVRTRPKNANTHPGTVVKDALRARNPPRDPDIIQKEKADKEGKKMAKQKALEDTRAKEESATRFVEEYRARKETEALNDDTAVPRQKPKGKFLNLLMRIILYCTQLARTYLVDLAIPENQQRPILPTMVVRHQTVP